LGSYKVEISNDFSCGSTELLSPVFAGLVLNNSLEERSLQNISSLQGGVGIGAFSRNQVPWNKIADWTHSLPSTPTDTWMDVVDGFVRGPNHRWLRHNPIDFLGEYLSQGPDGFLSLKDYCKHIFCDLITTKGIPILPEPAHNLLVSLGVPPQTIYDWTHLNIWDLSVGCLSVGTGVYDVFLAITGQLPWGLKTMVFTFGLGSAEIAGGIYHGNPLLVAGGALKVGAGMLSLWDYFAAPAVKEIPVFLQGLFAGAGIGSVVSAVRIGLSWKNTNLLEKSKIAAENVGGGAIMGALTAISPILSIVSSISICSGKMAYRLAQADNEFWAKQRLSSPFVQALSSDAIKKFGGEAELKDFESFLEKFQANQHPLDKELECWLNKSNKHLTPLDSCKHVFENRKIGG